MANLSNRFPCLARLQFIPDIIFVPPIHCASPIKTKWRSNEKENSIILFNQKKVRRHWNADIAVLEIKLEKYKMVN